MSSENSETKIRLLDLLRDALERVDAKEIVEDGENLFARIYGFLYTFIPSSDMKKITYMRNCSCGNIPVDKLFAVNSITFPFFEYTKNEEEDDAVSMRSNDISVLLHFLLPGDYFIDHENCYAEGGHSHRSMTMCHVVEVPE